MYPVFVIIWDFYMFVGPFYGTREGRIYKLSLCFIYSIITLFLYHQKGMHLQILDFFFLFLINFRFFFFVL